MKTMHEFVETLSGKGGNQREVRFSTEALDVNPEYHLTEVRVAACKGMDCGGNVEQWTEVQIQLLESQPQTSANAVPLAAMSAMKMSNILTKAASTLAPPADSQLVFELTTRSGVLGKWQIGSIDPDSDQLAVRLTPMQAVCKPAAKQDSGADSCCGPVATSAFCETSCCA